MRALAVSALLALTACAPGQPKSPDGEEKAAEAPPPGEPGDPQKSDSRPLLELQRGPFMKTCLSAAGSGEYCACGFEQFREVFRDADLLAPLRDGDSRLAILRERTIAECASLLSEEQVERNFLDGCEDGDARKRTYCACAWRAMRKDMAVSDFVGTGLESPRLEQAKRSVVKTCRGKFPEAVAREEFRAACAKSETEASCACLWKKLRAQFSVEELATGTADVDSAEGLDACR